MLGLLLGGRSKTGHQCVYNVSSEVGDSYTPWFTEAEQGGLALAHSVWATEGPHEVRLNVVRGVRPIAELIEHGFEYLYLQR